MPFTLEEIVPWGRSLEEYTLFFALSSADLSGRILGCGDGPASFNAEATARGGRVVSIDPLYQFAGPAIAARFEACYENMVGQVRDLPGKWNWELHHDPDQLGRNRRRAMELFLADYDPGLKAGRYVAASLPELPFEAGAFDLALCSHLLFLYSDHLSEDFHVRSVAELGRVARDIRLFPLLTLAQERSPHIGAVCRRMEAEGWKSEFVRVRGGLQKEATEMLRFW